MNNGSVAANRFILLLVKINFLILRIRVTPKELGGIILFFFACRAFQALAVMIPGATLCTQKYAFPDISEIGLGIGFRNEGRTRNRDP